MFLLEDNNYSNDLYFNENGLLEIALDGETSFNNIMVEGMQMEFQAYKNNDKYLLQEAKDNVFKRFLNWIKEKAKQIIAWFASLKNRLVLTITNVNKFVGKYQSILATPKAVSIEVKKYNDWDLDALKDRVEELTDMADKIDSDEGYNPKGLKSLTKERDTKNSDLKKIITDEAVKATKLTTIKAKHVAKAFSILKESNTNIKLTESAKKYFLDTLKRAEASVKSSMGKAEGDELKKATKKMNNCKTAIKVGSKEFSIIISLLFKAMAESLAICKKALSKLKKKESYDFGFNEGYDDFDSYDEGYDDFDSHDEYSSYDDDEDMFDFI